MATSTSMASALPCIRFNQQSCESEGICQYSHAPDSFSLGSGGRNVCLGYLIGRCDGWSCHYSHNRGELLYTDEELRIAIQERLSLIDMWNGRMARIFPIPTLFPSVASGFPQSHPQPVPALATSDQAGLQAYPTPHTSDSSPPGFTEDSDIDALVEQEEVVDAVEQEEEEAVIEIPEPPPVVHKLNPTAAEFIPPAFTAPVLPENQVVEDVSAGIENQPEQPDRVIPEKAATKKDLEQLFSSKPSGGQELWGDAVTGDNGASLWDTNPSKQQFSEERLWDKQTTKNQKPYEDSGWDENPAAEAKWLGMVSDADFAEPTKLNSPPKPSITSIIDSQKPKKGKDGSEKRSANFKKRSPNSPTATPSPIAPKYANSKLKSGSTKSAVASWTLPDSPQPSKSTKEKPSHLKTNEGDGDVKKPRYNIPLTPGVLPPNPKEAEEIRRASEEMKKENLAAAEAAALVPTSSAVEFPEDRGMKWVNGQDSNWDYTPDPPRDFTSRSQGNGSTTSWGPKKPSR